MKTVNHEYAAPRRGRGASINPEGRFEEATRVADGDWLDAVEIGRAHV